MLVRIVLVALLLVSAGCEPPRPRPKISKVISEKLVATEQGLTFDFFDDKHVRSRAESVYYLIAEDGTTLKVSLKEYAKVKVGQSISSSAWEL
jgi:hypothetical protein